MKTLFDSVLINRIQLESNSSEVQLTCRIFENKESYDTEVFLSMSAFNQLLCELEVRGFEIDMENDMDFIQFGPDDYVYTMDLSKEEHPCFLPLLSLPKENKLLRA
ncbi:hypothetical protein [Fluviicola taffensis]|uniref:Uncharacterized protein n=1 Tax=Fluviicola taffensis (strain DSM 16823 / NCIMB 13979 / RW262) TaxID=755732 RepID=F2I9S5_FLUTR|nr:hypothetical protein [Fluviicola taffensis]AEA43071.1 hypothetical protein Fluta_1073 [Fluviicola taffensis DSM 16823]